MIIMKNQLAVPALVAIINAGYEAPKEFSAHGLSPSRRQGALTFADLAQRTVAAWPRRAQACAGRRDCSG